MSDDQVQESTVSEASVEDTPTETPVADPGPSADGGAVKEPAADQSEQQ